MPRMLSQKALLEIERETLFPIDLLEIAPIPPYERFVIFFVANVAPVSVGSRLYQPLGFSRGPVDTEAQSAVDRMTLQLDNVNRAFTNLVAGSSLTGMRARIRKTFIGIGDLEEAAFTIFDGFLGSPSFNEGSVSIEVRSVLAYHETELPRRLYASNCGAYLGDEACGVDMTLPINRRIVQAVTGSSRFRIVSNQIGDVAGGHWKAGYIRVLSGPMVGAVRPIRASLPGSVSLEVPLDANPTGADILIQRGCFKHKQTCDEDFDNLDNYQGFSEVPRVPILPAFQPPPSRGGGK